MSILHLPFCALGKHKRSRGRARQVNWRFESVCRHCGVRMHKEFRGWYALPRAQRQEGGAIGRSR